LPTFKIGSGTGGKRQKAVLLPRGGRVGDEGGGRRAADGIGRTPTYRGPPLFAADNPARAYCGVLEAICDTSNHFPSRFSKTSVSNVGALIAGPDLSFPSAFTIPMAQATSPFT
jgi:hypothetical protein